MKLQELHEMIKSDAIWLQRDLDSLKKKREAHVQAGQDTHFTDLLIAKLEKALKAALMAKESVNEGKTHKDKKSKMPKAPRAKHLHDVMAGRKAGGHFTEKTDFKRAKEKQKFHKELKDQE